MINTIMKIALTGLMAAGIIAYGQEPAAQPQPAQQGQSSQQSATQAAGADEVFAALDTNHDGKLSQEEFGKLFRNAKEADVVTEFTRWDKNGDKVITVEEFKAVYPQAQH